MGGPPSLLGHGSSPKRPGNWLPMHLGQRASHPNPRLAKAVSVTAAMTGVALVSALAHQDASNRSVPKHRLAASVLLFACGRNVLIGNHVVVAEVRSEPLLNDIATFDRIAVNDALMKSGSANGRS